MRVLCDYCGNAALLASGREVYPHRNDLAALSFWKCAPCDAWVSCHELGNEQGDGTKPMGRLANAELRSARRDAHAAFDSLWRDGTMSRSQAYAWLSAALGISRDRCHIGMFEVHVCFAVVHAVRRRTAKESSGFRVGISTPK